MNKINSLMHYRAFPIFLLFLVAAIWGSGFIASQIALDAAVSPALLMFIRFTVATLIIAVVFRKNLKENLRKNDLKKGFIVGLFLFASFYIQIVALQFTTPSNNAFITSTNVVMVPLLWWAISKKRPEGKIFLSSLLCIIGIGVLSIKLSSGISFSSGDILTLICAFFFACHITATGKYAADMDTIVLVFLQFITAAVLSLAVFLLTDRSLAGINTASGLGAVLYLGIFSTCVCYFLQTAVQKYVSSSKAALILSTEALFGTLFSVIMGYDKLSAAMLAGGGIIITALLITEVRLKKGIEQVS